MGEKPKTEAMIFDKKGCFPMNSFKQELQNDINSFVTEAFII